MMPVPHIFQDAAFSQEHIDLMTSVFEQVIRELGLTQGTEGARHLVANAIRECAQRDIFDPFEMRKCAHEVLLQSNRDAR
jgi:hypothetical protein